MSTKAGSALQKPIQPELALFADKNGTALIKKLIEQAIPLLPAGGLLIIEADPYQHAKLIHMHLAADCPPRNSRLRTSVCKALARVIT